MFVTGSVDSHAHVRIFSSSVFMKAHSVVNFVWTAINIEVKQIKISRNLL